MGAETKENKYQEQKMETFYNQKREKTVIE
jgi:hypothetical protein